MFSVITTHADFDDALQAKQSKINNHASNSCKRTAPEVECRLSSSGGATTKESDTKVEKGKDKEIYQQAIAKAHQEKKDLEKEINDLKRQLKEVYLPTFEKNTVALQVQNYSCLIVMLFF